MVQKEAVEKWREYQTGPSERDCDIEISDSLTN